MWFSDALHRADVGSLYTKDYFVSSRVATGYADYHRLSRALERNAARRLLGLERIVRGRRSLLDIGCGTGEFLHVASRRGWDCTGVEISAYAAEYARTQYGVRVHTGPLEPNLFPERTFSVVSLWDVIEHLPDPAATLALCARLLRPRGILTLSTGDVESLCARLSGRHWHLFNLPEHVFFFSARSIRILLRRTGFASPTIEYRANYYPVGYLLERLYKTVVRPGRPVPRFVASWLLPCNLFDIMQITAVARGDLPADNRLYR